MQLQGKVEGNTLHFTETKILKNTGAWYLIQADPIFSGTGNAMSLNGTRQPINGNSRRPANCPALQKQ